MHILTKSAHSLLNSLFLFSYLILVFYLIADIFYTFSLADTSSLYVLKLSGALSLRLVRIPLRQAETLVTTNTTSLGTDGNTLPGLP